jgi:Leucine-rich repeat (LRR) protein
MPHGESKNEDNLKPRHITQKMLLKAATLTKSSKESTEQYLQRVTHLHLQSKRLMKIENLESCTNLKVLYLYDNQIETIENLDNVPILQYLLLQNNRIDEMPPLHTPKLRKLYLDENQIEYVTGLEECERLEELHIGQQRIPSFTGLQFDPMSLQALGKMLEVLEISGNGIKELKPFGVLYNLRRIYAGDNNVSDLAEIEYIVGLQQLETAVFLGNPCCSHLRYRDSAIGASSDALKSLDHNTVLRHQQVAIRGLMVHRRKCGFVAAPTKLTSAVTFDGEGIELDEEGNVVVEIQPSLVDR